MSQIVSDLRRAAGRALLATEDVAMTDALAELEECASELDPELAAGDDDVNVVDASAVTSFRNARLVAPRELRRRTWGSTEGRFSTLHALAHIEANAVYLALDAVHRFGGMPSEYYLDWTKVALEERSHYLMLCDRLVAFGGDYGDLPCHNGLWEIAEKTADDVMARMALVPMVFEARGLDVTPALIERFERHGDQESADVLRVVLRDEIGHVDIGRRWFEYIAGERGLEPRDAFEHLVANANLLIVPPFNVEARVAAGFDVRDLERWDAAFVGSRGRSPRT